MTEYASLKPNRDLLNAKFDSYHLGLSTLEIERKSLLQSVAFYPLTDEHYSFSHLKAHADQNLLVLDLWNKEDDALYFIDESHAVMGLLYDKVNGIFHSPVTMCKFPAPAKNRIKEHISPSIVFPSPDKCLINDGAGKLFLCKTGNRSGSLEKQNWECGTLTLLKDLNEPFYMHQCCQHDDDNIHCLLMSLEDEKKSTSSHPKVFLHLLIFFQNDKGSSAANDRFILKSSKIFSGISVPHYTSYGPDFKSVIIASQKAFSSIDKEKEAKVDDASGNGVAQNMEGKEEAEEIMLNEPDQARSTYTSEQMEDCDIENEEDVKLYVIDTEDESIKLETSTTGHQWLFNQIFSPQEPAGFCVRHDVDGLLWQPVKQNTASKVSWEHTSSFNALGYVQASKKNHKYTVCGAEKGFVAIVDCASNIYIYVTESISSKDGFQYVLELPTTEEILGVCASKRILFLLTRSSCFAIKVL